MQEPTLSSSTLFEVTCCFAKSKTKLCRLHSCNRLQPASCSLKLIVDSSVHSSSRNLRPIPKYMKAYAQWVCTAGRWGGVSDSLGVLQSHRAQPSREPPSRRAIIAPVVAPQHVPLILKRNTQKDTLHIYHTRTSTAANVRPP